MTINVGFECLWRFGPRGIVEFDPDGIENLIPSGI